MYTALKIYFIFLSQNEFKKFPCAVLSFLIPKYAFWTDVLQTHNFLFAIKNNNNMAYAEWASLKAR